MEKRKKIGWKKVSTVAFLECRLLSSQSEQFKKYSKSFHWLKKSRPSIKATFVLIM